MEQINKFVTDLNNTEYWAINMFDSWGKIPSGILSGNVYALGNYDQCLKVKEEIHDTTTNNDYTINGQHCVVFAPLNLNLITNNNDNDDNVNENLKLFPIIEDSLVMSVGVCLPATCDPVLIKSIADVILLEYLNTTTVDYDMNTYCSFNQDIQLREIDIVAIIFFSVIILISILSTIYELYMKHIKRDPVSLLLTFSIYKNACVLFSCRNVKSVNVLNCLNGIRVLSIMWVVIGHTFMMTFAGPLMNAVDLIDWLNTISNMTIAASTVSVDTFLLLSGLLVTWALLKELDNKRRLNIFVLYLHRYLRLTPAFGAIILFILTIYKYLGSGPLWKASVNLATLGCEEHWWSALLYVQNYVNPEIFCLGHSWYLSVDMQLFILSPLIIYPLWRWGKHILWIVAALIISCVIYVFVVFFVNEFTIKLLDETSVAGTQDEMRLIYYPTHARMGSWLIGVILGYLLRCIKGTHIELSKIYVVLGWALSLGTIGAIIFGYFPIQKPELKPTVLQMAFYESFSRVTWSIALSWIIFACVHGYGGYVNWFLSLPQWQPLARLSYCIYLIHLPLQLAFLGTVRHSSYFTNTIIVQKYFGYFVLTTLISIIFTLLFELPIAFLERIIFHRDNNKSEIPIKNQTTITPPNDNNESCENLVATASNNESPALIQYEKNN